MKFIQDTIRSRLSFFKNRAIFKKTEIESSNVTIPIDEARALGMDETFQPEIDGVILSVPQREVYVFRHRNVHNTVGNRVKPDTRSGFTFSLPDSILEQLPDEDPSELFPAQFIVSTLDRKPDVNIPSAWYNTTWERDIPPSKRFNVFSGLVWKKSPIEATEQTRYVSIEKHEADYHDLSPGDKLNISGVSIDDSDRIVMTDKLLPNSVQVVDHESSLRIPFPDKFLNRRNPDPDKIYQWLGWSRSL